MADVISGETAEINEAVFCRSHFKEVCTDCNTDLREENDGYFGFDFFDRDGLEAPPTGQNKDNVFQCKKHSSASTSPPSGCRSRAIP
ncbi:hypothetical protein BC826DRAFT_1042929 [Russula brevipes]|nr:hypothetical protein BC826DRAFT_1042929 [Russula brevipes]